MVEYNVLAADIAKLDAAKWTFAHVSPESPQPVPTANRSNYFYWLGEDCTWPGVVVSDINTAMDDGSVTMLKRVTANDTRIASTNRPGVWAYGWVLPDPLNL